MDADAEAALFGFEQAAKQDYQRRQAEVQQRRAEADALAAARDAVMTAEERNEEEGLRAVLFIAEERLLSSSTLLDVLTARRDNPKPSDTATRAAIEAQMSSVEQQLVGLKADVAQAQTEINAFHAEIDARIRGTSAAASSGAIPSTAADNDAADADSKQ